MPGRLHLLHMVRVAVFCACAGHVRSWVIELPVHPLKQMHPQWLTNRACEGDTAVVPGWMYYASCTVDPLTSRALPAAHNEPCWCLNLQLVDAARNGPGIIMGWSRPSICGGFLVSMQHLSAGWTRRRHVAVVHLSSLRIT